MMNFEYFRRWLSINLALAAQENRQIIGVLIGHKTAVELSQDTDFRYTVPAPSMRGHKGNWMIFMDKPVWITFDMPHLLMLCYEGVVPK